MALKKTWNFCGIPVNDAYIKVHSVSGSKTQTTCLVGYHVDSAETQFMSTQHTFAPDMNGGNFIAQAYAHLKTLPEFAGATDC
jgi:hypothetical protein